MKYLEAYLKTITNRGNIKLSESIFKTANDIGNKYIENFSFVEHKTGLLFGNIQSGKTSQMFGVICKATDLGFPIFIILTTDNVILQQQTLERVKKDLTGFCICGENDSRLFIDNNLIQPTIVVLKKNYRILKLWSNIFISTGFIKGNPLFIIDDEADAASLNTLVNKNKQSSINKYLEIIKNSSSSSLYLQVTGTPQALLLQTKLSGWHPYFTYYFQPGDGYLGGDFFFSNKEKQNCIMFIDKIKNITRNVVIRHLVVSAQILSSGGLVSNCLVHPSVRQLIHQKFADDISKEILWCKEHLEDDLNLEIKAHYETLNPKKNKRKDFTTILNFVKKILLNNEYKILIMNGKYNVNNTEYSSGCNFIVGGNTLGRGVTFPQLQTIYYTRTSKNPQADTMWQHSRMFGYDRDPGLMRVYIDKQLYKLFSDINATNNSIIAQIEHNISDLKIYYSKDLNPTRKNVIDKKYINTVSGGTNYYPLSPKNNTIEDISKILRIFSEKTSYYPVNLKYILQILQHIIPSPDFKLSTFQSVIKAISSEKPTEQGVLIVRRNRDITQGTGALLSADDWKLSNSFPDKVVLTMYQVTGKKGWNGEPLWIPNIKLPNNIVYYDVIEM